MNHRNFLSLLLFGLLFPFLLFAQQQNDRVKLNQLGFYPNSHKLAITPTTSADTYYLQEVESGIIVYTGTLESGGFYSLSGESVKIADFSDFTRQGSFILSIEGGGESFPFEIGNNQFTELNKALIKALYYNRASMPLEEEFAGKWSRLEGHPDSFVQIHPSAATDERPAGSTISSPGGWYDAGDFNKYIVPISSSVSHLLTSYEHFESYFSTQNLTIPESTNAIPDILDEARYALDWMLTMQDPNDGGVYHKLTHAGFQATVMPHIPTAARYVVQKGTAATLTFAAAMAQASRVYAPFDQEFSTTALNASIAAYEWALSNPNIRYNQNSMNSQFDPDINTGEYGGSSFSDEFFWARSELYVTTKDDQYYPDNGWSGVGNSGWGNVQALGLFSLLHHRKELTDIGLEDTTVTKNTLVNAFEWYVNDSKNAPYRSPFGLQSWQFNWGSNGGAGNLGMAILMAYQVTGDQKYYEGAIDVMDYLLGRNPVAYSYVTGFGDQTPQRIHHRQSEADNVEEPVPGWVAGGPNPGNQNQDCGASSYNSTLPALSYLDSYCSYSTNEITTYWNSPFVFLTAGLEVYTEEVISESDPKIEFTSPTKDNVLDSGDDLPITWNANEVSTVDLSYKLFSDDSFSTIATGIDASTGSYTGFTIPSIPGDSLLLKIQNSSDENEFAYSPIVYIKRSKSIRSITAETKFNLPFNPGLKITINWDAIEIDSLDLYYYLKSNSQLVMIAEGIPGSENQYTEFLVPDSDGDSLYFRLSDSSNPEFYLDSPGYEIPTSVSAELEDQPFSFQLEQNYPNPFNPSTEIGFTLAEPSFITLSVYDLTGREVVTLLNEPKKSGRHQVQFDASQLSSGVYIYTIKSDVHTLSKTMMLIK